MADKNSGRLVIAARCRFGSARRTKMFSPSPPIAIKLTERL